MEIYASPQPGKMKALLVTVALLIDGVGIAAVGLLYLFFMVLSDPAGFDVNVKYSNMQRGELVFLAGLAGLLICLVAAIFWRRESRFWKFIVTSICILGMLAITGPIIGVVLAFSNALTELLFLSIGFFPWSLLLIMIGLPLLLGLNIFALKIVFAKNEPLSTP